MAKGDVFLHHLAIQANPRWRTSEGSLGQMRPCLVN